MIFLFEEFRYHPDFLKDAIGVDFETSRSESGFNINAENNSVKIKGVGYCFCKGHPVFVLPKVFLNRESKAFGVPINIKGEDVFGGQGQAENEVMKTVQRRFLSSLSFGLYSAIDKYNKSVKKNSGVRTPHQDESKKFEKNSRYATLIDIISSMELFFRKNQSLFVFVAKNKRVGNHRVNWARTVCRNIPFDQDETPVYINVINKAKVFDLDDRLLVLYFSAMKYIQDVFGYVMPQSDFYQPLKKSEMERLLDSERGVRELRKIKYKYFDDRLLKLYNIVEAFFRWGARYKSKDVKVNEYLIVNSFNNVFEAMVDSLIGDQGEEIVKLKNNEDGKIVDHLYKDKSLFATDSESNLIWYIGDSKYYKDSHDLDPKSIAKQYTYAKNIMQYFFSDDYVERESLNDMDNQHLHNGDVHRGVRYRDPVTEGYNIVPNFFIRGEIPEYRSEHQYRDPYFRDEPDADSSNLIKSDLQDLWPLRNRQFRNRLFDRDTLFLQVYDINFMFVLKAYVSKQSAIRDNFKVETRNQFRDNFVGLLNQKYAFWKVVPKAELASAACSAEQNFVSKHFRVLLGKIFKPSNSRFLVLALEKSPHYVEGANEFFDKEILDCIQADCEFIRTGVPL